jgi:hypothetical protein
LLLLLCCALLPLLSQNDQNYEKLLVLFACMFFYGSSIASGVGPVNNNQSRQETIQRGEPMKSVFLIFSILLSNLSMSHYNHGCKESIECIKPPSDCIKLEYGVHSFFYLVKKTMKCTNSHNHQHDVSFFEREEFKTKNGYSACSGYHYTLQQTYGICED